MLARFVDEAYELHGIQIEQILGRLDTRGLGIVPGQRQNIFDAQGVEIFQRLQCSGSFASDAREVNIGCKPARARGSSHANRIVTQCAACVTRDASGNDAGHLRQFGSNFEQASLAGQPAGDQFHDVAESASGQRFPQWIRRSHVSALIPSLPAACLPPWR